MLINYWLRRSDLSHDQLARIADWGLGETGWLTSTQISHLRNRNVARGASARNIDGIAGANRAIWLWNDQGHDVAMQELGPHSSWGVDPEALGRAIWLPSERHPGECLDYGEIASVNAGRLTLGYLNAVALSPSEAPDLSVRLSALLNELVSGGTPAEGIGRVLDAYPLDDLERREHVRDLMLGAHWTQEQMERELYVIAVTISRLRGEQNSDYGPAQLHAELASHRRRT
jgi:hypothetical protein